VACLKQENFYPGGPVAGLVPKHDRPRVPPTAPASGRALAAAAPRASLFYQGKGVSHTLDAETASVQYVFLDVVGFTKDRSVEAQSDIIENLNRLVGESLTTLSIPREKLIVLPSGDGMCLAVIELTHPFDVNLQLALDILERIDAYNLQTADAMRRFQVRIGINENIDNLITDFNGNRNVAGAGINMAQRIMEKGDECNVLISENVYETLRHREKYMNKFRPLSAKGKHGLTFNIYQYIKEEHNGLNTEIPSIFTHKNLPPRRLSKFVAYYLRHAIANRDLFLSKKDKAMFPYAGIILLYFLANDDLDASEATQYDYFQPKTWSAGKATVEEQLEHYYDLESWVLIQFSKEIMERYLDGESECFEESSWPSKFLFVGDKGRTKLKQDWPEIWAGLEGFIED
jgi:class 3 adenylate cyclase